MNWSRENPRYRRSSALIRRKKKKSLFNRLDSWWRGRKESAQTEAGTETARHRPDPPVPPELLDELKIAVPRARAPKPRPAPRVCPPPKLKTAAATELSPSGTTVDDVAVKKSGVKRPRRKVRTGLERKPTEETLNRAYLTHPLDSASDSTTLTPVSLAPVFDGPDDDLRAEDRKSKGKDQAIGSGPDEPSVDLSLQPEDPIGDDTLVEESSTVIPVAIELDRSGIKTIPASIYQSRRPEPGSVRLVTSDDDSAEAFELANDEPTVDTELAVFESASVPEGDAEADDLFDSAAVSVEAGPEDDPDTGDAEASLAPLTATSRREATVEPRPVRSAPRRPRASLVGAALGRSALLRWGLVAGLVGILAIGLALSWPYFSRPAAPTRAKVARIPAANLPKVLPLAPGFYELYARQKEVAIQTEATIGQGSGLGQALEEVGLGARQRSSAIIECLTKDGNVNPNAVRAGVTIKAYWSDRDRNELRRLEYHPETGAAPLVVMPRADGGFWLYNTASALLTLSAAREGVVDSSLWQAGSEAGLDANVIKSLSNILASDVDFLTDIKKGATFQVLFSRDYRDGRPEGTPIIDMVKLVNKGKEYEYYRFVGKDEKVGYYDAEGRTSHKTFFISPLQYTRISSKYTMNRMHPIHKVVRPHQGVDYAAPSGTPISTVADGTVIFAGWNGGYGRLVTIKHDETYTTMYAHMSRFAPGIAKGVKVKQGDLIGHVGATGTATGPHLDFRLKKNGKFTDPLPELAAQQGRKLESGDYIDLTKAIGEIRQRMAEQLAASHSSS